MWIVNTIGTATKRNAFESMGVALAHHVRMEAQYTRIS